MMNRILWQPTPEAAAATQIAGLARSHGFEGEHAIERLRQWSVEQPAAFWQAVWQLGGVKASWPQTGSWSTATRCRAPAGSRALA